MGDIPAFHARGRRGETIALIHGAETVSWSDLERRATRRARGLRLVEFLEERLQRYKIPRSFEFIREPLRDEAGKMRRSQLRRERLGLAVSADPAPERSP